MGSVAWFLLSMAVLGVASLNVRRTRSYFLWKVAILASELGHWLAALAAILSLVAVWRMIHVGENGWDMALSVLTVTAAMVSMWWFMWPWSCAKRVWHDAKRQFERAFPGGGCSSLKNLSAAELWKMTKAKDGEVKAFDVVSDGRALSLDFYPTSGRKPAACVVMIHGGGWDSGDRTQMAGWNHWLAREGYAVAALSYRLAPENAWPAQREDVLTVLSWLRSNAQSLGIDPDKLVLFGRSAGGQIATAVAYGSSPPGVCGVVSLYSPYNLHYVWSIGREDDVLNSPKLLRQFLGGAPDGERKFLYDSASPELMVDGRPLPPTFLLHGELDELVWCRHSQRLAESLSKHKIPHVFIKLPWATHAVDFIPHGPSGQLLGCGLMCFLDTLTTQR